jgi:hypothetical protein
MSARNKIHSNDIINPLSISDDSDVEQGLTRGNSNSNSSTEANASDSSTSTDSMNENVECIICLSTIENEPLNNINEMQEYTKTCKCKYHVHKTCFERTRVENQNAYKCLMCRSQFTSIEMGLVSNLIITIHNQNGNGGGGTGNEDRNNGICNMDMFMRRVFYILYMLCCISTIGFIIYITSMTILNEINQ